MQKIIFLVIQLLLVYSLSGCGSSDSGDNGSAKPSLTQAQPSFLNPLIQNGNFLPNSHWNDPHVIYLDEQFVMYASVDIAWNGDIKIYRLVSPDGINWSLNPTVAVLEKSASGWDSHATETPAVVYFQGNYHLFYTGYDVAFNYSSHGIDGVEGNFDDDTAAKHFKIGHAISADGIHFIKQGYIVEPTAAYLPPNFDFNQYTVGEPAPVVFNNKIYLYFTAIGADSTVNTTWQTIGLLKYDGSIWEAPQVVLKPDLSLFPRNQYLGYSTPNAVVINNKMHLYYDVVQANPWAQVALHHAYSGDGETAWVQDIGVLRQKTDYAWTADEIRSPSALTYNNMLYLYFAGHVLTPQTNLAIGLEVLTLP